MSERRIIHIDMDAFFAAVAVRDNPALRGKPILIGGRPGTRSVVSTCSYEARKFGIHSAMPVDRAVKLCPQVIIVSSDFEAYNQASRTVMDILSEFSDQVEAVSIDEAYLDVTDRCDTFAEAVVMAEEIRRRIREATRLTASAGVSVNMFLAKVASDFNKPDGLKAIPQAEVAGFVAALPVRRFPGVGPVTEKHLLALGLKTGADVLRFGREALLAELGKCGLWLDGLARGVDHRQVVREWERKSISKERTFTRDLEDRIVMEAVIEKLSRRVGEKLRSEGKPAGTVTLKIRFADFRLISRSVSPDLPVKDGDGVWKAALDLFQKARPLPQPVRLLGVGVSQLLDPDAPVKGEQQLLDFSGEALCA